VLLVHTPEVLINARFLDFEFVDTEGMDTSNEGDYSDLSMTISLSPQSVGHSRSPETPKTAQAHNQPQVSGSLGTFATSPLLSGASQDVHADGMSAKGFAGMKMSADTLHLVFAKV
jgi:hypothetical protein